MAGHPVTVTVAGVDLDPCTVGLPLEVVHGRSGIGTQPDAPTATFTVLGSAPPADVGDTVTIAQTVAFAAATYDSPTVTYDDPSAVYDSTAAGAVVRPRFAGYVAGMQADEQSGQVVSWKVTCVGVLARLGFLPVVLSRPAELDTARVAAIAAAAGVTVSVRGTSTVVLAPADIDGDALSAVHEVAASAGGLLFQTPAGALVYGTSKHRTGTIVGTLDCDYIADGITWADTVEAVVNHITVQWGPDGARGEATHQDAASIAAPWGVRHIDLNTICDAEADADQLALMILARYKSPFWNTPGAMLYGHLLDPDDWRTLAALDVSAGLLVPIGRDPSPTPAPLRAAIVEGWVETWDTRYTMQLALSDMARWVTTRPRRWNEADDQTWAYWRPKSWLDMLVLQGVPT